MRSWFEVLSDLFVNIAAAWFVVVFIEPNLGFVNILSLILKFMLGIVSLILAKKFKDKSKRYERRKLPRPHK